jgi:hypothetical protein
MGHSWFQRKRVGKNPDDQPQVTKTIHGGLRRRIKAFLAPFIDRTRGAGSSGVVNREIFPNYTRVFPARFRKFVHASSLSQHYKTSK